MERKNTRREFFKKLGKYSASAIALVYISACSDTGDGQINDVVDVVEELTEIQKTMLLFMYQEEKVARDVYITLGNIYPNEPTFANIQLSEQDHMDAVEILCVRYGVDIAGVNEEVVGEFIVPELQSLYDTMVLTGSPSIVSALEVGEQIEITDIEDLENASIGMPNDVVETFNNLIQGSANHLAAFRNALTRQ